MLMADVGEDEMIFVAQSDEPQRSHLWFLDSGCTNHMSSGKEKFINLDLAFTHLGNSQG